MTQQRSGPWNSKNHELLAETERRGGNPYVALYNTAAGLTAEILTAQHRYRNEGIGPRHIRMRP